MIDPLCDVNIVKQIPRKNEKPIVFRNKKYINKSRGQHASLCRYWFEMLHNHDGNIEIQKWNLKATVMEALKA